MKSLTLHKSQESRSLYSPKREVLPRVVFNSEVEPCHSAERRLLDLMNRFGIECNYEPFLFQMWDPNFGCQIGVTPDFWLPSLDLIVEIGSLVNKPRKMRLLRDNFPHLRFALLQVSDIESAPSFKNRDQFMFWLGERIATNDRRLAKMSKSYICSFTYRAAIDNGASQKNARRHAKKARLKL